MNGSGFSLAARAVAARAFLFIAALALANGMAMAQVTPIDPDAGIDADLGTPPPVEMPPAEDNTTVTTDGTVATATANDGIDSMPDAGDPGTYQQDDLLGAAEGVFGKGAQGLAGIIESILKKQGRPNAYIVGREGSFALGVGLRYGSGTLHHKIEGDKPVYWTGPSIGFDAGGNVGSAFVLVYNLYDGEDLYKRFASAEGVAYLVGGFNASYLRKGDVVLIPIRVGAGLRLGANVGYMKFSKKRKVIPF